MAVPTSQASSVTNSSADTMPSSKQTQDAPTTSSALLLAMVACSSVQPEEEAACTSTTWMPPSLHAPYADVSDSGADDEISGSNTVTDFSDVGSEPEEEINLSNWQDVGARIALALRNHVAEDGDSTASSPRSQRRPSCTLPKGVRGVLSDDKFNVVQNWQDVGSRIAAALRDVADSEAESEEMGSRIVRGFRVPRRRRAGSSRMLSDAESAISSRAAAEVTSGSEADSDTSHRMYDNSDSEFSSMRNPESAEEVCERIDAALLDPLNRCLHAPGALYYEPDDLPEEEHINVHNWKSVGQRIAMILADTNTTDDDDEEFSEVRTVLGEFLPSTSEGGSVTPPEPFTDDYTSAISTTAGATVSDTDS